MVVLYFKSSKDSSLFVLYDLAPPFRKIFRRLPKHGRDFGLHLRTLFKIGLSSDFSTVGCRKRVLNEVVRGYESSEYTVLVSSDAISQKKG
jgi:hypothetical protein